MPSLKSLKIRITSVKSTQKITKAMKMVAAAKLRRAREQAEASRPYAEKMDQILRSVAGTISAGSELPKLMGGTGKDDHVLLVVATADRGLCGAFNSSIVRATKRKIIELQGEGKKVTLLCLGKKGYEQLSTQYKELIADKVTPIYKARPQFSDAQMMAEKVLTTFDEVGADRVVIVYNAFISAISQKVTFQQLIPLKLEESRIESRENDSSHDSRLTTHDSIPYEFEPAAEDLLADLLPRNLSMRIFKALLENAASEQGARMTAMDNASRNAGDMIKKLSLQYNRTRQAVITKELIEIISGAEAV